MKTTVMLDEDDFRLIVAGLALLIEQIEAKPRDKYESLWARDKEVEPIARLKTSIETAEVIVIAEGTTLVGSE